MRGANGHDGHQPMAGTRRLQLLVGRTAAAVPGALAGGAVGLGSSLSLVPTVLLGIGGATLGAIAATADRPRARCTPRHAPGAGAGAPGSGDTPPEGIGVRS